MADAEFERRLYADLQGMDDPLALFLEYISSQRRGGDDRIDDLRALLQRCIRYVWSIDTYLDDPRFVGVCLQYAEMAGNSAADRAAMYRAMHVRGVGGRLAMYYEACAGMFMDMGREDAARSVVMAGLECGARPLLRLQRVAMDTYGVRAGASVDWSFMDAFPMPEFLQRESVGESRHSPVRKVVQMPGRMPERIDCNFDLLYTPQQEYSVEQLLARSMGVYGPFEERARQQTQGVLRGVGVSRPSKLEIYRDDTLPEEKMQVYRDSEENEIHSEIPQNTHKKIDVFRDESPPAKRPALPANHTPKRAHPQALHENITTTTLPLNDEPGQALPHPHSPTVTMFSKDAMSDVYSMFNQNNNTETFSEQSDNTTNRFAQFEGEGFTQEMTRQNIDDLTEVKPAQTQSQLQEQSQLQLQLQPPLVDATVENKSTLPEFMTPIQEHTEETHLRITPGMKPRITPDMKSTQLPPSQEIKSTQSSPFLTQPQRQPPSANVIEHPLDTALRQEWLSKIQPPLDEYKSFYRYNQPLRMSALLKKIHKASKSENKNPIVDFKKTGDLYCIRSELGQGGYAIVYLAESSTGNLKALKIERPASMWEYYILRQVEMRLSMMPVLRSIIQVDSLHYFLDESYLVLNYANQGTVLDLINMVGNKPVDELLCMFLTVEMMKAVESLHEVGIIHGDLKPDNCMIRFEPTNGLGVYNTDDKWGWDRKGIFLIDFGRSFDMRLLPEGTRFKSDWRTDQQDCSQMRLGKEWTYEADYYGLAGIIHSLLFGSFIDTVRMPDNQYKLRNSFKRYWHTDIWKRVFSVLLNSGDNNYGPLPLIGELRELRHLLEDELVQDHNSDSLRRTIADLEEELAALNKDNI